ncbi:MAG: hypothetical protein B6244_06415 [Candidatus Cloacimonetes bacterium 4572_55]|nr:MAG: hypothetical protein B6244_06415 [Candidatus Cloacimonetes bacterium 4572_55]
MTAYYDEIIIKVPSGSAYLELIRSFISLLMKKAGFSESKVDQIELAVDEACSNVVKYAYDIEKDKDRKIEIRVEVDRKKATITVRDHGKGFDPDTIYHPNMEEYLAKYKSGGLGIYIMQSLMDEISYDVNPGRNTAVKMVKYLENT